MWAKSIIISDTNIISAPDNRILECAMAAHADWIVSGDRHLLALNRRASSAIVSPANVFTELQK